MSSQDTLATGVEEVSHRRSNILASAVVGWPAGILAMPALIARTFAAGLLAACLACDLSEYATPAPSEECRESGALCQLESGPLGVCESRPCRAGEAPPCFTCTPQH